MKSPFIGRPVPDLRTSIPGPLARAHVARDEAITSPSLPRAYPFVPVRGAGAAVEDIDGNLFLDFCAGIAVNATGHAHPAVVASIRTQASELLHYSASDFYPPIYAQAAERLAASVPFMGATRVFFGNSGAEAVEAAMKLARHHTGRPAIVGFVGGFHGRTYGAVSLTASKAKYHARFGPLLPAIHHVEFSHAGLDELEGRLFGKLVPPSEIAAIVVEPIQGEGGYRVAPDGFLARLRELCDAHGILLVADEVQSGAGRTGRTWAIEHDGVAPDILVAAKGIASGLPLGAIVARAEVMSWHAGAHGSTFGGNPVSLAAMLATFDLLDGGLTANAAARGAELLDGLRTLASSHTTITDVRGRGLMVGLELATPALAAGLEQEAFRRGLLVLECGERTVRLSPPLVIDERDVATAISILDAAIASL